LHHSSQGLAMRNHVCSHPHPRDMVVAAGVVIVSGERREDVILTDIEGSCSVIGLIALCWVATV
jgi:hypothetical protein